LPRPRPKKRRQKRNKKADPCFRSSRLDFCSLIIYTLIILKMKKIFFTIIFLLSTSIVNCEQQMQIIKDVRGDIYDDSAQIVIEANCNVDYIDYTLSNPPRLIIDPIGKVYSDLKEVINFDAGPIKKIIIIKGRPEEGLTGNYYPLDFISIELAEMPVYKVRKEVKEQVIVEIAKKEEKIAYIAPAEEIKETTQVEEPKVEEVVPLPEIRVEKVKTEAPPEIIEEPKKAEQQQPNLAPQQAAAQVIPLEEHQPEAGPPSAEKKFEAIPPTEPAKFNYKLGEGDNLDISVWQHPELDKRVVIRPDGYISFPLVGDIKAAGLTPPQLTSSIRENLSRLIKDPQVTVIVSGFGSKNVFVLGEVTKPGVYPFRGGINILEAISQSGGWKNSAVLNSVMLVRNVFTDRPEAYRLNVYAIIKNGDFSQNLMLQPGDVVYVPKSFVANIGGFIENLKITVGAYVTEGTHIFD